MKILPNQPFTTADFSLQGGGIDFLGLRWVSLTMVGRDLVPELNNVTQDMGIFCLGAWIPWKFRQLCRTERDYTEAKYKVFREKIEVALSMTFRDEANLPRPVGKVRRQLGSTQKVSEPQRLSFKAAKRGDQNSIYAAANYGPALQALGLIKTYRSRAEQGASLRIPIVNDDRDTIAIVSRVDEALRTVRQYELLNSLETHAVDWDVIHHLGVAGLDPARYREISNGFGLLKKSFRSKLLPTAHEHPGYRRTLTARLILATLRDGEAMSAWDLRHTWYTGQYANRQRLELVGEPLIDECRRWSCLMARQYQRFPLEVLLWCFEQALADGMRSIDEVIAYWRRRSTDFDDKCKLSLEQLLDGTAASLRRASEIETSRTWNRQVQVNDALFEHVAEPKGDDAVSEVLHMIGGWYWRALIRMDDPKQAEMMNLGGPDRVSMAWFIQWLRARLTHTVEQVVRDLFSGLVFAQHMRIALARYDGRSQRLRFALADNGIEPTLSARKDLAKLPLPWMPDRLDSLVGLLSDCDVLEANGDLLMRGRAADQVIHLTAD